MMDQSILDAINQVVEIECKGKTDEDKKALASTLRSIAEAAFACGKVAGKDWFD